MPDATTTSEPLDSKPIAFYRAENQNANMSDDSEQPRHVKSELTSWGSNGPADRSSGGNTDKPEWVEGLTLVMVITGITLVVFLMLLDMSIVSTV